MKIYPTSVKTPVRGFLSTTDGKIKLLFDNNPESLSRSGGSDYATYSASGTMGPRYQYTGGNERTIIFDLSFNKVNIPGGCKEELAKLETMSIPDTEDPFVDKSFKSPPELILSFGDRTWEGFIKPLEIKEEKYNADLEPEKVTVSITFVIDMMSSDHNKNEFKKMREIALGR